VHAIHVVRTWTLVLLIVDIVTDYSARGSEARYCDDRVCFCVRLFVCPPLYSRNYTPYYRGVSRAEWLACWTQAQKGPGSNRSCKLLTPTVPLFTKAEKFVAALLRVAGVTAGLAKSNGSLPPGL